MKVVHIGYLYGLNNTGGAAIAATRLHLALLEAGVESHYACVHKCADGPNVHVLPRPRIGRALYFILTKLTRCIWKFSHYRRSICLNLVPMFGLEKLLASIKPDIVHVQWINADVCSFEQLARLPYKLVLNLHDRFLLLPGKTDGDECYREGLTDRNSMVLERWLVRRRKRLVEKKLPVFVGPSEWACEMCRQSLVGRGQSAYVVPNVINSLFRFDPDRREKHDKMVMLFCAYGGRHNPFKGWCDCEQALCRLPTNMKKGSIVHVAGEKADDFDMDGLQIHFLGEISNPETLVDIYHASDVFLFPSVQETQGMTKVEASLCGLPVITFDRTACAEGVVHEQTGWIAADGDIDGFVSGLRHYFDYFITGTLEPIHRQIAERAREMFDTNRIVNNMISVYENG